MQGSPPGVKIDVSISDRVSDSLYICGRFKECTRSVLETLGGSEVVWHTSRETVYAFQAVHNPVEGQLVEFACTASHLTGSFKVAFLARK